MVDIINGETSRAGEGRSQGERVHVHVRVCGRTDGRTDGRTHGYRIVLFYNIQLV